MGILISFSTKRPITIFMIFILLSTLGGWFWINMTPSVLPNIQKPSLVVVTSYPNQSPKVVESEVTKLLEDNLNQLNSIKFIKSTSTFALSTINIEFNWGVDVNIAHIKLKELLDKITLPKEALKPKIRKFSSSDLPIISFDLLNSKDNSFKEFSNFIENSLKVKLERVDGVSKVDIYGIDKEYIEILIDNSSKYHISYASLINQINSSNYSSKIGEVYSNENKKSLTISAKVNSLEELKSLPIYLSEGKVVKLREIAKITIKNQKKESITQVNFNNSIHIDIKKDTTYSSNEIIDSVVKILKNQKYEYIITKDDSIYIKNSQESIISNIILGIILSTIIIIVFMGNLKVALIIAITAPLSIIVSINILEIFHIQKSVPMLAGLSIGTGLVIDSSVVFIENIYKHMQHTNFVSKAIVNSSNEVATGIVTSSLTTIAVFFPMIFISGLIGEIFFDLALSVISTIVCSSLVAFTIIPALVLVLFRHKKPKNINNKMLFEKELSSISNWILKSLKNRLTVFFSTIIFAFAILTPLILNPLFVFMPEGLPNTFIMKIVYKTNYDLNILKKEADKIANLIKESINDEGLKISTLIDKSKITFTVTLQNKNIQKYLKPIEDKISKSTTGDYEITLSSPVKQLMGGGKPLQLLISSEDSDKSKKFIEYLKQNRELFNSTIENKNYKEFSLFPKYQDIENSNTSLSFVANELLSQVSGIYLKEITLNGKKYSLKLRGRELNLDELQNSEIIINQNSKVLTNQIAFSDTFTKQEKLIRYDKYDVVEFKSDIYSKLSIVVSDIEKKIEELKINTFFVGEAKESEVALNQSLISLLISIVLIYLIMAALFESLLFPISIMFTLVVAISAAVLALHITGNTLSTPTFLGMSALAGIVVNNGIILIEFINILRRRMFSKAKALKMAIVSRTRPILITSLTSILGMIPMIFSSGQGSELYKTMAIVLVGGMLISTPLTLFVVPSIYLLLEDLGEYLKLIKMNITRRIIK